MSRKANIIQKAVELFAKNGIESTTVQDITEACGISKGAFYLAFKSKEDLITAIIDDILHEIMANNNRLLQEPLPPQEILYRLLLSYLELVFGHAPFLTIYIQEQLKPINEPMLEKINEVMQSTDNALLAVLGRLYGDRLKTRRYDLLITLKGMLNAYIEYIVKYPQPYHIEELARFLLARIDCIVNHHPEAFITPELWQNGPVKTLAAAPTQASLQQLAESYRGRYPELPLAEETLQLLAEELSAARPREALLKGLLSNLLPHREFAFLIYNVESFLRRGCD